MVRYLKDPAFYIVLLIQLLGILLSSVLYPTIPQFFQNGFGLWANIIQVSGVFAVYHILTAHRIQLHQKLDKLEHMIHTNATKEVTK